MSVLRPGGPTTATDTPKPQAEPSAEIMKRARAMVDSVWICAHNKLIPGECYDADCLVEDRRQIARNVALALEAEASARASAEKERDELLIVLTNIANGSLMRRALVAEASVAEITRQRDEAQADEIILHQAYAACEEAYERLEAESSALAQKAQEAERERCAKIADEMAMDYAKAEKRLIADGDVAEASICWRRAMTCSKVAAALRALPSAPPEMEELPAEAERLLRENLTSLYDAATPATPETPLRDWINRAAEDVAITLNKYERWREIAAIMRKYEALPLPLSKPAPGVPEPEK
jgi:hypothetical protein